MAIGDYYSFISNNKISKTVYRILGIGDLHTHIRLKPMLSFLKYYFNNNLTSSMKVVELGCGSGINAFEIYKIAKKFNIDLYYIGVDLSQNGIDTANKILQSVKDKDIKRKIVFYQEDANIFLENHNGPQADIILLIDIIEHIRDPEKLIHLSKKILKNKGLFIVSIPTPLYPKFFGRDFHDKIGHLVDGYSLDQLDRLFEKLNCERIIYKYNTGLLSNIGCWLYYNKLSFNNKYFNFLKSIALYPFKFLDIYNNSSISCSLFAVYKNKIIRSLNV